MRPDERIGPKFLLYHDVAAVADGDERRAREAVRTQLTHIAELGYRFVPMSSFVAGERLGPRDAIITVDDGARSFITCMLPVLEELEAPVTLFILTDFMGRKGPNVEFMSWEDVGRLSEQGIEFGCHGVTHVPLDQVGSERMKWEVEVGTSDMVDHGLEPTVFAYPFGRFDGASKLTVRKAGYQAAFSVMKGGFDRYEIRRRLFTGFEGPVLTRLIMSDCFFELREAARAPVPSRLLKQETPVSEDRWGPDYFGLEP